jgi:hypothetical protein
MSSEATSAVKAPPDVDWEDLKTPFYVPIAGGAMGVCGLVACFAAAQQMLVFVPYSRWMLLGLVPLGMLALFTTLTAPFVVKARAWASIFGLLLCGSTALALSGWWIFALSRGSFSLLVMMAAGLAWFTVLLIPLSIGPSIRLSRARRALYRS